MVWRIIKWVFWTMIIALLILWILGGGVEKVIKNGTLYAFSWQGLVASSSSLGSFQLPFAPSILPQIPAVPGSSGTSGGGQYMEDQNPSLGKPNGAQSPYAGDVVMAQAGAIAQSTSAQYIELSEVPGGPPINIAGWTLQSALTGALATIPQAASPYILGRVNTVGDVSFTSGSAAYVVTGPSPVGVSFSENECTGYLGTLQPYVPPLPQNCPLPSAEIPETAANEAQLGASCFNYINSLPPCTFPANPPSNISSACRTEIQTKLSYNACIAAHENDPSFSRNSWRIYLAQGRPLWSVQHDVIRLLDGQGRLVSVLNY